MYEMYIFIYFSPDVPVTASLHSLLFYDHPFESPVDRQGYLPTSRLSCFTAADFVMALNSLDDSVVPKKDTLLLFFPCHPTREAGT